jgi:predicted ATPase/DNA-binding SARP family transcriptional activator
VEIRVLGSVEVVGDSVPVVLGAKLQRRLLAALTLRPGESRPVELLCEALWPERPPPSAAKLLRIYVSQLRKLLPAPARIVTRAGSYALDLCGGSLDVERFEQLIAEAHEATASANAALAAALFGRALALWRGPAYGEFADEEFARLEAARLEELRQLAQEHWLESRLALGELDDLLPDILALAAAQPLRERTQRNAIVALYRSGRQPEALELYATFRRRLADELGLEPSPPLRDLQRQILRHDPVLAAPPTTIPRKGSLPTSPNPLIGREREVGQLRQLLTASDTRLVVVTGAGGSGKTRLALEIARELADEFANGAAFVSLAPLADPTLVPTAIGEELSVERHAEADQVGALAHALRNQELLLVLDNFEHVRAAAPALVELLAAAPRLRLLVTSRIVLHLSGEHVYRLEPLSIEAAGVLFRARAAAASHDLRLNQDEAEAIIRICTRVDGLPLAVELAAARTGTLTPRELLARLDTRLPELAGGPHDLPARQRTLQATIEWSHDLLDDAAQTLFRRLSVFAGRCTLAATEIVCAGSAGALEQLVDHNLVTRAVAAGESRFAMLETVREFARKCLEHSGETDEISRRHAVHFASLAAAAKPELLSGDQTSAARWFSDAIGEIRVALDWCARRDPQLELQISAATARFWIIRGNLEEGRRRLEHALAGSRAPTEVRASALHDAALLARIQQDFIEAEELAKEGIALSRQLGDWSGVARSLNTRTAVAGFGGDWETARALSEESLQLALSVGDERTAAFALFNLADVGLSLDRLPDARQACGKALQLFRRIHHPEGVALALGVVALAAVEEGNRDEARQATREGLAIAADLDMREPLAWCLEVAAALAATDEKAATIASAAERVRESIPARPSVENLHRRTLKDLRERLGTERLDSLTTQGRQIPQDQAVKLALDAIAATVRSATGE